MSVSPAEEAYYEWADDNKQDRPANLTVFLAGWDAAIAYILTQNQDEQDG